MPDQPTSVTVIVGAVSAVAGALVAGLANAYAAKQRVREIEVSYLQRLKDGYLENARKVTAEVYIPISIALTSLGNSYDRFSAWIDPETRTSRDHFREDFLTESLRYLATIEDLMSRGADAYLTTALDEKLQSFTNFIRDSMDAKEVTRMRVMKSRFTTDTLLLMGIPYFETRHELIARIIWNVRIPAFTARLLGFEVGYSERTYSAPIESRDFEALIRTDITALKALVKEVTLGSRTAS